MLSSPGALIFFRFFIVSSTSSDVIYTLDGPLLMIGWSFLSSAYSSLSIYSSHLSHISLCSCLKIPSLSLIPMLTYGFLGLSSKIFLYTSGLNLLWRSLNSLHFSSKIFSFWGGILVGFLFLVSCIVFEIWYHFYLCTVFQGM